MFVSGHMCAGAVRVLAKQAALVGVWGGAADAMHDGGVTGCLIGVGAEGLGEEGFLGIRGC